MASGLFDFESWSLFGSATVRNQTPGNGFTYSDRVLIDGVGSEAGARCSPDAILRIPNSATLSVVPISNGSRGS